MKYKIKYLAIKLCSSFLFMLILISCNSNEDFYTLTTPADQMKLTVSSDSIVLHKCDSTKEAVNFTWSDAADRGGKTKIVYYFRMYIDGDTATHICNLTMVDSLSVGLGKVHSISFTTEELNNALLSCGYDIGDKVEVVAEVIAQVIDSKTYMKPELSKVQFNICGY